MSHATAIRTADSPALKTALLATVAATHSTAYISALKSTLRSPYLAAVHATLDATICSAYFSSVCRFQLLDHSSGHVRRS